ncbi:Peptidase, M20/M25/M40 family protein [uncultured delta proteobacterium]|uniref:Peptidase, M20/M25/M40 family protein n=1 Tax=uncultured delta proteobacterium TaxID=34034 RepID=A0A212K6Y2_9DELT|nr:Peptidase, M20/M25/M40 family protein [uncultured delta proteobacterium]
MDSNRLTQKIHAFIDAESESMFGLLRELVNRDSGSRDIADVNALGDFLAGRLEAMGCGVTKYPHPDAGFPLAAAWLPDGTPPDARRVLLVGHRDTVFPSGTAAARPYAEDGVKAYGPGVSDMKGGIVAGIYAMKALMALRGETGPLPMELLLTSDEEIGSAASAPVIEERCRTAKAVFFLEPARANGALVIGRDGGALLRLEVHGKSAHAGNNFAEGVSAINGLAGIISDFAPLSDDAKGYSVNVGVIGGGSGAIIVADHAWGQVYTRFATLEQRKQLLDGMRAVVARHNRGGLKAELHGPVGFLPFLPNEANTALFSLVKDAGNAFGLALEGVVTRGAADAGVASTAGVPTLCGMGPVGGELHTDREFMVLRSLPERAKVLALSIALASERFR